MKINKNPIGSKVRARRGLKAKCSRCRAELTTDGTEVMNVVGTFNGKFINNNFPQLETWCPNCGKARIHFPCQ